MDSAIHRKISSAYVYSVLGGGRGGLHLRGGRSFGELAAEGIREAGVDKAGNRIPKSDGNQENC